MPNVTMTRLSSSMAHSSLVGDALFGVIIREGSDSVIGEAPFDWEDVEAAEELGGSTTTELASESA